MLTKQQALKILDDTVEYYRTNSRGLKKPPREDFGPSCVYYTEETGAVCAVGRLANEKQLRELHDNEGSVTVIHLDILGYDHDNLPFFEILQAFHDSHINWTKNEVGGQDLTDNGEARYRLIKNEILQNYPEDKVILPIGNQPLDMTSESKKLNQQLC